MAKKQRNLNSLVNSIWNNVKLGIEHEIQKDENVGCAPDGKEKFRKSFKNLYNEISEKFMEDSNGALDRHKVAAITMISIIDSDLLFLKPSENKVPNTKIYFGKYVLAANSGLDYLLSEINIILDNKKSDKELSTFNFPEATSCPTDYFKIFFRNLYYADNYYKLNPLDLAERLFLLEQLTFMKFDIDASLFKEY